MSMPNYKPKTCKQCGTKFAPTASTARYCSDECRKQVQRRRCRRYYHSNPERNKERVAQKRIERQRRAKRKLQKECEHCGATFQAPNHKYAFCSDECRKIVRRQKQNASRVARRRQNTKKCKECGSTFTPNAKTRIYCTRECYEQAEKRRTKAAIQKWRDAHPEYDRQYYQANVQKYRERARRWRENNREHRREMRRKWAALNPDKVSERVARRARVELEGNATTELIEAKWDASDKTCCLCGEPIDCTLPPRHRMSRTLEHLTPICRGGRHDIENLGFAHFSCNASKKDKTLEEYKAWLAQQRPQDERS